MEQQEQRLQQEILAEAKKRADRVLARATADAAAALKRAEAANEHTRVQRLQQAKDESAVESRNIIQGIWIEKRRMWLMRREECLDALFAQLLKDAAAVAPGSAERKASLAALAKEAIGSLQASSLVVSISPADAGVVTADWLTAQVPEGLAAPQFTVQTDPAIAGGLKLSMPDGQRSYDNTYAGRLHRLHEDFRRELAGCDTTAAQ